MSFTANFATKWIFICIPKIVDIWLKTLEIISKKLMKFNKNKYIFNLKKIYPIFGNFLLSVK